MEKQNNLVVIPARSGSKRIPQKNLRDLGGVSLIVYSIRLASEVFGSDNVVVTSDSEKILKIAESEGVHSILRPEHLATDGVTLDPVIHHAVVEIEKAVALTYDNIVTIQATSPLLSSKSLIKAYEQFNDINLEIDTLLSVKQDNHLAWKILENKVVPDFEERKNTQELPPRYVETGGFLLTRRKFVSESNRLGKKISIFELKSSESIDIDTEFDWWIAEKLLARKKIVIRVLGNLEKGLGHAFRCLSLVERLIDHEVVFVCDKDSQLAFEVIKSKNYKVNLFDSYEEILSFIEELKPDLVINDKLNTSAEEIDSLKKLNCKVINFEDFGTGTDKADAVINALQEKKQGSIVKYNTYLGSKFVCINDGFKLVSPNKFGEEIESIFLCFGATDPSKLGIRILKLLRPILKSGVDIHYVAGYSLQNDEELQSLVKEYKSQLIIYKNISHIEFIMASCDIAVTSGGRTVFELASMNIPSIVIAHNKRESDRPFYHMGNGILHLGLGSDISNEDICLNIENLINNRIFRKGLYESLLKHDFRKGLDRVTDVVKSILEV